MDIKNLIQKHCFSKNKINSNCSRKSWWGKRNLLPVYNEIIRLTSFLNESDPFSARVRLILNDVIEHPKCRKCNAPTKYNDYIKKYNDYCSVICGASDKKSLNKKKQTNLEKYGVSHPISKNEFKEKRKQTNLERYGANSFFQTSEFKQKTKLSNLTKYGVEYASSSLIIKEKRKQTNLERYGVDNPSKIPEVIEKRKATIVQRYGEAGLSSTIIQNKKKQTNLERYGVDNVNQRHLSGEIFEKISSVEYILKLYQQHLSEKLTIAELSDKSSVPIEVLKSKFKEFGLKSKRFRISVPHKLLIEEYPNAEVNNREIIHPQEIDLYFPNQKVGIEIDGLYWHTMPDKNSRIHLQKIIEAERKGINLIRLSDEDIISKFDICKSLIDHKIGKSEKIHARKCIINTVNKIEEKKFFEENHILGFANSKKTIGLFYGGELVYLMSFGTSRFNKNYDWEIIRAASKKGVTVMGGASKVLKRFILTVRPESIITYADRRYFTGKSYVNMGMEYSHSTSPGVWYWSNRKGLEHRMKYQKHKLPDLLENFDPNLTEKENMINHGFRIYYDCGQMVYTWRNS